MAESIWRFAPLIFLPLIGLAAWWVWQDAKRLKEKGAHLTPDLWGILVLVIWLVALPSYLILRRTTWRREIDPSLPPSRLQILQRNPYFHAVLDTVLALVWLYLSFAGSMRILYLILFLLQVYLGIMNWRRALSASTP